MNSSNGNLIEKTPLTDIRYKTKEELLRYVEKCYNHMDAFEQLRVSKNGNLQIIRWILFQPAFGVQCAKLFKKIDEPGNEFGGWLWY